jgi:hypothetical protein
LYILATFSSPQLTLTKLLVVTSLLPN